MSSVIYFAFVPIVIWLAGYLIIETREKAFHRYFLKKTQYYIWSAVGCVIAILIIVIVALLV